MDATITYELKTVTEHVLYDAVRERITNRLLELGYTQGNIDNAWNLLYREKSTILLNAGPISIKIVIKGTRLSGETTTTVANTWINRITSRYTVEVISKIVDYKSKHHGDDTHIAFKSLAEALVVNNNYELVFYNKKTDPIDEERPLTGLVCPSDERLVDYNYGTFCSKDFIILGREAFVLPDVINFIMNSRYYIGH